MSGTGRATAARPAVGHGLVLRIAVPVSLVSLSTPMVGAVDTAVIGQLGDPALIGGIASASVVFNLVFLTLGFLRVSTTGLAAQAAGAGEEEEVLAIALRACGLAVLLGVAVLAARSPIGALGFELLGIERQVRDAAQAYFDVRVWSAPFVLANFALLGWLIGTGAIATALLLQVLLNVLNVVLSIWFVVFLGYGVEGAGAAAVLAEAGTALVGIGLFLGSLRGRHAAATARARNAARMRQMISINTDILVRSMTLFLAIALFTRQSAQFGTVVLAANAILLNLFYLSGALMNGLATAAQQLAGNAVGAGDRSAFLAVVRLTRAWGLGASLGLAAIYAAGSEYFIALMTSDPEVAGTAHAYYWWVVLVPPAGMLAFIADGIFMGATWAREARNMMLLSAAAFIGAWLVLTPLFGNAGLWAAFLCFLAVRGVSLQLCMPSRIRATFGAE